MSHRTPTSSVMDGASLALIGTMLKMLLSTHHQVWPLDNIPYTHSWAQQLLILVWPTFDFLANVSTQHSL